MANAVIIKSALQDFVEDRSDNALNVFALTGGWGVGKTYLWDSFIVQQKEVIKEKFSAYSYVSLFSLTSLDQLKEKIFTNSVSYNSEGEQSIKENFLGLFKGVKSKRRRQVEEQVKELAQNSHATEFFSKFSGHAKNFPLLKSFSSYIGSAEYFLVDNFLICIDDIERRSAGLSIKEVLGLVDELCTKKRCKVVFIFNHEKLKDVEEYNSIREKVVDLEVEFTPTYSECIDITHSGQEEYYDRLVDFATKLECTNLRVMQKARWVSEKLLKVVEKIADEELPAAIYSNIWCNALQMSAIIYDKFSKYSVEELEGMLTNYAGAEDKPVRTRLSELVSILQSPYDELSFVILSCFRNGIPDKDQLDNYIRSQVEIEKQNEIAQEINSCWSLYHRTFEDNRKDFERELLAVYEKYSAELSLKDFASIVNGLKLIEKLPESMIEEFLGGVEEEDACVFVNSLFVRSDVIPELLEAIEQKFSCQKPSTLAEAIDKVCYDRGWNTEHNMALDSATKQDYLDWINSEPAHLIEKIRSILAVVNWEERQKPLMEALSFIYESNDFARLRMEKMLPNHFPPKETDKSS